ncbi:MAG: fatty acid desaturase [Bdellovibrionota bacterium]
MNSEILDNAAPTDTAKSPRRDIGFYRQALIKDIDPETLKPRPIRLVWYMGFFAVAAMAVTAGLTLSLAWPFKIILGLIIGTCTGAMGFATHEILHGSVVKNKTLQNILGFFGFGAFFISPTFWRFWHNRLHHGKTQKLIHDPDAFPTMKLFKHSKFMQAMFPFTPGSGHKRSATYMLFWFSFHVFVAQSYLRFRNSIFEGMDQKQVTIEFVAQLLIVGGLLVLAGPSTWWWLVAIPFVAQNYFAMSYIATNHNLSPLTSVNDPLLNTLTVTNHPLLERLHLNFGYHVEHHIFPTMSGAYTKEVHRLLKEKFPEDLQVMPKAKAMKLLYLSSRIYKNSTELIHPHNQTVTQTLGSKKVTLSQTF